MEKRLIIADLQCKYYSVIIIKYC